MRKNLLNSVALLYLTILLAACGSPPATPAATDDGQGEFPATATVQITPSASSTPTPDPCGTELVEPEVQKVHRHMREFDDAAILASNLPREQLSDSIENLQRIRREAEDEEVPACLTNLKGYQVDHMNTVINTLVVFMGGADSSALEQGIAMARNQHDQYTLELARLLGLTVVPVTESVAITPTGTATP